MDFTQAKKKFAEYLKQYDSNDDKIKLKIVHTYGVIHDMEEITRRMGLGAEDTELAKLIALLHDIGRFEQLRRFDSFEPGVMDHAAYGVEILFGEGMIRQFVEEDTWDNIIRTAIARHSDFKLEGISDSRELLHARLIRDADKLDNCRVKLEEKIETLLGMSAQEVGKLQMAPKIYEDFYKHQSILSADRKNAMDHWVSYIAYFYDINFKESMQIIKEKNYVPLLFERIPYSNPDTAKKMQEMKQEMLAYVEERVGESESKISKVYLG